MIVRFYLFCTSSAVSPCALQSFALLLQLLGSRLQLALAEPFSNFHVYFHSYIIISARKDNNYLKLKSDCTASFLSLVNVCYDTCSRKRYYTQL